MELSKEEINQKTNNKIQAIKVLCQQLGVELLARQVVTEQGFIENIIIFNDKEKYEIIKDLPVLRPHDGYSGPGQTKTPQKDEKTADLRK